VPRRDPLERVRIRGRSLPALLGALALAAVAVALWWAGRPPAEAPAAATAPTAAAPEPVPVLVYLIDTLRADRMGLYGNADAPTPAFEALAREAVVFERAYSVAPWTLPSVPSILTSTPPCEHGVLSQFTKLGASLPTLAEQLRAAGYRTGAFYNNMFAGPMVGLDRGYDVSVLRDDQQTDSWNAAAGFLDGVGTAPFLLYVHTMEPHQPYYTPQSFTQRFGHFPVEVKERYYDLYFRHRDLRFVDTSAGRPPGTTDNTPEQLAVRRDLATMRTTITRLYDASVSWADDNLGRTLEEVRRRGLWDRALIVVLADHGEEHLEHGDWFHDQSAYDELLHVPLVIKFPGGEHGGTRVRERVSLLDVKPTILGVLGRPDLCAQCRGLDLRPLVRGERLARTADNDAPAVRINVSSYFRPARETRGDTNVVVRREDWKAIWNEDPQTLELYDLVRDPGEQEDRSRAEPARAEDMRTTAIDFLGRCRDAAAGTEAAGPLDERSRERMRGLGYLN